MIDWSKVPKSETQERMEQLLIKDRIRGFDLTKAPLMRVILVRLGENLHHVVFTSHHIITDGWSHATVLSRMFTLYQLSAGGAPLPQVGVTGAPDGFKEFIDWSLTRSRTKAEQYWKRALAGVSDPTPIPIVAKTKTEGVILPGRTWVSLVPELTQKLRAFADKNQFTLGMVLNAAWGILLHKYSGNNDVVFGTAVSVRPPHIDVNAVGLFMNTIPVRLVVDDEKPATDVVRALSKQQIERSEYEHLPLAAIQACTDIPKGASLMDSIFVVENFPIDQSLMARRENGISLTFIDTVQKTNFVFVMFAYFLETQVKLQLTYDAAVVQPHDASRMAQHYIELLTSFVQNPSQPTKSLSILTEQEKDQILVQWNDTSRTYTGAGQCAHQLVMEQAKRTPQATALVFPKESGEKYVQPVGKYTYQELDEMSNVLAQYLISAGVKVDDLVGLCVEQSSWVVIVAMIGIWKAGGAYVALNPNFPSDRLKYMIEKTKTQVVLTLTHLVPMLKGIVDTRVRLVDVDGQWEKIKSAHPPTCPRTAVAPNNLAYVLFTSGSTGLPKGVMIEHKGFCCRAKVYADAHFTAEDRVAQTTQYSFDPSCMEILGSLCCGASLYLVPNGVLVGPELASFFRNNNITSIGITPSRLATLKDEKYPSMKRIVAAGEQLTLNIVKMVTQQCRIFNAFGPTEITFANLECECFADDTLVTIGKTLPNYVSYVLDRHMQPVPIGVFGELYIGGTGVARGYLDDPAQTKLKFVPNPFMNYIPKDKRAALTDRIYKTGDVVRFTLKGEIEYIGRSDFQVKLRGVRMELGEIETVITQAKGVRQVVVLVADVGPDNKVLVAYVVPEVDETELRAFLASKLPVAMIPQVFMMMREFPMNTSGKVERKLLPPPQAHISVQLEPQNDKERILLYVWSKVLNVKPEQVGTDDMFFSLGGNSITAVTLVYHAKQQGLLITTQQVLTNQTLRAQAEVSELVDVTTVFNKQTPWGAAPLLPLQQWIIEQPLRPSSSDAASIKPATTNQYALLQLQQIIDVSVISRALGHLLVHHPILRASYDSSTMTANFTEPSRDDIDKLTQCGLHIDLSPLCETFLLQGSDVLPEDFADMWEAQLNPAKGLCVRGVLISSEAAPEANPKLLIVVHHLCVDKTSWKILFEDLQAALTQLLADKKVPKQQKKKKKTHTLIGGTH